MKLSSRFYRDVNVIPSDFATSDENETMNSSLKYVETDFSEFMNNRFLHERILADASVYGKNIKINKVPNIIGDMIEYVKSEYAITPTVTHVNDRIVYIKCPDLLISSYTTSNSTTFEILGSETVVKTIAEHIEFRYDVITVMVCWVTNTDMSTSEIPLFKPKGITDSAYPFIEEGVDKFVDDYLNSTENVLLLIGQPGTGKSNLIKHIVSVSGKNTLVTYDTKVMAKDDIYAMFSEGNYGSMVIEDADALLGERVDGNDMMSRFLNSSDGIISTVGKKMIFSTNLPSLSSVDPALLRPGRLFAAIQFRQLTFAEAVTFAVEHKLDVPTENRDYSIAEIYNSTKNRTRVASRSTGFY